METREDINAIVEQAMKRAAISNRLLSIADIAAIVGKTPQTIYSMVREGIFPKPRRFGKTSTVWLSSEIDEYLKNLPRVL